MTARAMTGDRERCLAVGMDDYVSKPVRRSELERALRELVIQPGEAPFSQASPNLSGENPGSIDQPSRIIDWTAALVNVEGDRELLNELLLTTIEENRILLVQLDEAIAANDAALVRRLAHTIKGSAQAIAATATVTIAAAIEAAAAAEDLTTASTQMPQLRDAIERLSSVI